MDAVIVRVPDVRPKAWGHTRCLETNDRLEVHHATVQAGGYSSCHYHRHKVNSLYVCRGRLLVLIYANGPQQPPRLQLLSDGQLVTIPAGTWHRFEALKDTELIEWYYAPAVRLDDIERHDEGGRDEPRVAS